MQKAIISLDLENGTKDHNVKQAHHEKQNTNQKILTISHKPKGGRFINIFHGPLI